MSVSWSFGGTQLSSYGLVTMMDDYMDFPERRGSNQVIPHKHGTVFVPKFYEERKITLGLAIISNTATEQDTIFDNMRANFSPMVQKTLSMTREDSSVRTAQASVDTNMEVERITQTFARVVVEFTLAEPFFRSNTVSTDNTTTISTTDTTMIVENIGTIEERDPTIVLDGPLANVTISTTDNVSLVYTGTISSSDIVTIGSLDGEFYATHSATGNVIGNVTHSGASALLVLQPGTNNLSVKTTTTGGTVKITFYPPFL